MTGLHRPGTYVSEVNTLGAPLPDTPENAITVFIEKTNQGSTDPTLITNWNQFVALFGGFADTSLYLPYAVWQFFNNGGAQCYVARVLGTGTVVASNTLVDRAATPQNTLTVTAANAGTWGNSLRVEVQSRGTDRFDVIVYNGAATDANVVERWLDLSMTTTDARYVVNIINAVNAGSSYISVTNLSSATASPSNRPAVATTTLASGSNGSAPGNSQYSTAISTCDQIEQALVINLPGNSTNATIAAAITYAETRGDTFVVVDTSTGLTVASAVSEAGALSQSSYAAVYYPWLQAVDPGSNTPGATKLLPPGGAVCGIISRTDLTQGPFKAPAGLGARIGGVVALASKLASSDLDTLNDAYINAIRQHAVNGIVIMGARTLSRTTATRYVPVRRSLIYVKDNCKQLSEFAIFENNDGTTWQLVTDRIATFLTQYWQAGGLAGRSVSQAFYVVCDDTNNTSTTIAAGELHIEVGVAVESPAEFIVIQVGQWDGGSSAAEV